jgi:hypothetical protein
MPPTTPIVSSLACGWVGDFQVAISGGVWVAAGVRAGANQRVLSRICETTRIFNAWADEEWINEGAAVRVSLVAFGNVPGAILDGHPVDDIFANLAAGDGLNLTEARRLRENLGIAFQGPVKVGSFDIPGDLARQWLVHPNPNGRPNSEVLRPWANGNDVTKRASDTWIIDFGVDRTEPSAALYELPFAHVVTEVRPQREAQNDPGRKARWWLHGRTGADIRKAVAPLTRYIATSRVAKHRIFVWLDATVWPDSRLFVIARDDDTTMGILHSRIHEVWSLANASIHGDGDEGGRPTYNAKSCFENFPFPIGLAPNTPPADYSNPHASEIANATRSLMTVRDNWLNPPIWVDRMPEIVPGYPNRIVPKAAYAAELKKRTLTNLYNAMPPWLMNEHAALDLAVARAYGWNDYTPDMPDDEVLRRLLALNVQRATTSAAESAATQEPSQVAG